MLLIMLNNNYSILIITSNDSMLINLFLKYILLKHVQKSYKNLCNDETYIYIPYIF
jgi:hypothetical protein